MVELARISAWQIGQVSTGLRGLAHRRSGCRKPAQQPTIDRHHSWHRSHFSSMWSKSPDVAAESRMLFEQIELVKYLAAAWRAALTRDSHDCSIFRA